MGIKTLVVSMLGSAVMAATDAQTQEMMKQGRDCQQELIEWFTTSPPGLISVGGQIVEAFVNPLVNKIFKNLVMPQANVDQENLHCIATNSPEEKKLCHDQVKLITVADNQYFLNKDGLSAYYEFTKWTDYFNAPTCAKGFDLALKLQETDCDSLPGDFKSDCVEYWSSSQYDNLMNIYYNAQMGLEKSCKASVMGLYPRMTPEQQKMVESLGPRVAEMGEIIVKNMQIAKRHFKMAVKICKSKNKQDQKECKNSLNNLSKRRNTNTTFATLKGLAAAKNAMMLVPVHACTALYQITLDASIVPTPADDATFCEGVQPAWKDECKYRQTLSRVQLADEIGKQEIFMQQERCYNQYDAWIVKQPQSVKDLVKAQEPAQQKMMETIMENMSLSSGSRMAFDSRCEKKLFPKDYTVGKCKALVDRTKKFGFFSDFTTAKGMGMQVFSAFMTPPELMECIMLAPIMVDYTYVPKEKKDFCDTLPGDWKQDCQSRQAGTKNEWRLKVLYESWNVAYGACFAEAGPAFAKMSKAESGKWYAEQKVFRKWLQKNRVLNAQAYQDTVKTCETFAFSESRKNECLQHMGNQEQGKYLYYNNAALAALKRMASISPFAKLTESCKVPAKIIEYQMLYAIKDADYCNNVPTDWKEECVGRMLMEKPAFQYTDLSKDECIAGGFKFYEFAGCSSECAEENKSFNSVTKGCEWNQGFEPEEEMPEPTVTPYKPPMVDPKPKTVLPPSTGSKCRTSGDAVGKAIGRFRDMVGLKCNQAAIQMTFGAIAVATTVLSNTV